MTRWTRVKRWWNRLLSNWAPWRLRETVRRHEHFESFYLHQVETLDLENARLKHIAVDAARIEAARTVIQAFLADKDLAKDCILKIGEIKLRENLERPDLQFVQIDLGPFHACVTLEHLWRYQGPEKHRYLQHAGDEAVHRLVDFLRAELGEARDSDIRLLISCGPADWKRFLRKGESGPSMQVGQFTTRGGAA